MAIFLCQHEQLPLPVLSRLPEGTQAADYIRPQDLDFLQRVPSLEGATLFDRPGLTAELARYARCQVIETSLAGSGLQVIVRKTRPYWEKTTPPPELLKGTPSRERIGPNVEEWSRQNPPNVTIPYTVFFVPTRVGWRADYQLPERMARVRPTRPAAESLPASPPPVTESPRPANDGSAQPFAGGMTRPVKLSGPHPYYTLEALEHRIEGLMIVKCVITMEGIVKNCRVLSRFQPVTYQGRPVNVDYTFNLHFSFPDSPLRSRKSSPPPEKATPVPEP